MKDDIKDLNAWFQFIHDSETDMSSSKNIPLDDDLWKQFTQTIDHLNPKQYKVRSSEPLLQMPEKIYSLYSSPKQYFYLAREDANQHILPFDRSDYQYLKGLKAYHIRILDLHGYTLNTAYNYLKITFQSCLKTNVRLLKIITGKGRQHIDPDAPTLRQMVPEWFQEPYFKSRTLKIRQASSEHGGEGVLFVYLTHTLNR